MPSEQSSARGSTYEVNEGARGANAARKENCQVFMSAGGLEKDLRSDTPPSVKLAISLVSEISFVWIDTAGTGEWIVDVNNAPSNGAQLAQPSSSEPDVLVEQQSEKICG